VVVVIYVFRGNGCKHFGVRIKSVSSKF